MSVIALTEHFVTRVGRSGVSLRAFLVAEIRIADGDFVTALQKVLGDALMKAEIPPAV